MSLFLCRPVCLPAGPTAGLLLPGCGLRHGSHTLTAWAAFFRLLLTHPTLAHKKCSCAGLYDSQLDPQQDFSCLAVVLDMALTPSQPGQQPVLYEQCLEVVYRLAEQGHSREAMLCLLRKPPYSLLMSQIGVVLQVDEDRPQEVNKVKKEIEIKKEIKRKRKLIVPKKNLKRGCDHVTDWHCSTRR